MREQKPGAFARLAVRNYLKICACCGKAIKGKKWSPCHDCQRAIQLYVWSCKKVLVTEHEQLEGLQVGELKIHTLIDDGESIGATCKVYGVGAEFFLKIPRSDFPALLGKYDV